MSLHVRFEMIEISAVCDKFDDVSIRRLRFVFKRHGSIGREKGRNEL